MTVTAPGPAMRKPVLVISLVLIGVAWLGCQMLFGGLTIDDAFITWRYADNLVHHGIWNYNPSDIDLVEAYTNPSFAFLAILPAALGIPIEAFFKFFMAALGIVFVIWLWRRQVPMWQRLVLLAVAVANPIMHIHWWSGLETGLWIMIMTILFHVVHRTGGLGWWGHAGLLLLALTRPEGLGYLVVLIAWSLLLRRSWIRIVQAVATLAVLGVYWTARTLYFGRLLPNTFYAKTAGHAERSGLISGGLLFLGVVVLAPLLVLLISPATRERLDLRNRIGRLTKVYTEPGVPAVERARWTPVLMAVLAAGIQFVVYANSSLQMDYANRFAFQLVAPLLLVVLCSPIRGRTVAPAAVALVIAGTVVAVLQAGRMGDVPTVMAIGGVLLAVAGWTARRALASALAVVVLVTSVSLISAPDLLWMSIYRSSIQKSHAEVGMILARYHEPGATVVVHDAGVVPYEASGWEVIDVFGLATRRITDQQMSVDDLAEIDPEIVIADRFLGKRFLAKYGDRYDEPIPGSTIRLRKDADPELKRELTELFEERSRESTGRVQWLVTHTPSLEWLLGGTH
ncbi:hypothetical protein [Microlunatus sp. Y2014]|uniref:hypothetical protein n=1 Tax=Microlunatus sp. Y2014 TaxID=3418488 RepID=UPI003DA78C47